MKETQEQYSARKGREAAAKLPQPQARRESRNADGRTAQQQASLERRARFAYDNDCD